MPDITMCSGEHCKRRDKCYRHTAEKALRQSWFSKPPLNLKDGHCEYFWPLHGWDANGSFIEDEEDNEFERRHKMRESIKRGGPGLSRGLSDAPGAIKELPEVLTTDDL